MSLSLNEGVDFISTGLDFTYIADPAIERIEPSDIVSVDGNAIVVGKNFHAIDVSNVRCRFGSHEVQGSYVSPIEIKCPVPALLPGYLLH